MLHNLFERTSFAHSDHSAIQLEEDKPISYRELEQKSNQLAHYLIQIKINPQDHIVAFMQRNVDQVIVMLALSKIGAIYIPISTSQSPVRIQQILKDCSPKLIIANGPTSPIQTSLPVFSLSTESKAILAQPLTPPVVPSLHKDMIAYITYSSGSTGEPKGIPIKHAGLVDYWPGVMKEHILNKPSRVLGNVSIDFDAHIWEYLMTFVFGGTLYLTSEETRLDAQRLASFIIKHRISDMTLTPPVLRTFSTSQIKAFASKGGLKGVYSTGETCTLEIVRRFTEEGIDLYNCYGPSETTFGLSMCLCKPELFSKDLAPIHLPPKHSAVRAIVADEKNNEVKDGQAGELIIYSPYLTPGYINQRSDKFIKITNKDGQTIIGYKTGDKFIKQNDYLYYGGRAHQLAHIKIRGQFVDPVGIEGILRKHPIVEDVCVIVRNNIGKQPLLVAFIATNAALPTRALIEHCQQSLIPASIPRYFVRVPKLPLTINGKIDRDKLSTQQITIERDASVPYRQPRTTLEKQLSDIWKGILDFSTLIIGHPGIDDTFDSLGGDSIQLMVLSQKVSKALKINVSVKDIVSLEKMTIENMAKLIHSKSLAEHADKVIEKIKEGDPTLEPLFFLPPLTGESTLTYAKLIHKMGGSRRTIYVINAIILTNSSISVFTLNDMAEGYLALIRKIQPTGKLNLLGWSSGATLAYEVAQQANPAINFVGLIDEPAPNFMQMIDNKSHAKELILLIDFFRDFFNFGFEIDLETLAACPKDTQINLYFDGIYPEILGENRDKFAFIHNFLLASLIYAPTKKNEIPLHLFLTDDTQSKCTDVILSSPHLNWELYGSVINTVTLKGNHFSIIENPTQLAKELDESLMLLSKKLPAVKLESAEKMLPLKSLSFFNEEKIPPLEKTRMTPIRAKL